MPTKRIHTLSSSRSYREPPGTPNDGGVDDLEGMANYCNVIYTRKIEMTAQIALRGDNVPERGLPKCDVTDVP